MDLEKATDKFEDVKVKLADKLDRENGNYLVAGTLCIAVILVLFGSSTDLEAEGDFENFGQITQVNYSSSQLSEDTASNVAEALNESGWEESSSTVRKLNSSWYRVNLSTDIPKNERLTLDQQYQIQTTMTVIHHRAFNKSDNVILNIEAIDGSTISRFIQ